MTVAQRRRAVEHLKDRRFSERRACQLVGLSRSVAWWRLKGHDDSALRERLRSLAEQYPRYGHPTLLDMLRAAGQVTNHKCTYRIYREQSLQVRIKQRKKLTRPRGPMLVPEKASQRLSFDFVSDQRANGHRFRAFNAIDDFTRE